MLDPVAFVGRSPSQVTEFLESTARPIVEKFGGETMTAELSV